MIVVVEIGYTHTRADNEASVSDVFVDVDCLLGVNTVDI